MKLLMSPLLPCCLSVRCRVGEEHEEEEEEDGTAIPSSPAEAAPRRQVSSREAREKLPVLLAALPVAKSWVISSKDRPFVSGTSV